MAGVWGRSLGDGAFMSKVAGTPAIETRELRKKYGEVVALGGVDLSVEPGTVFGLLGPNGAGKTTAVRILTTLLTPDGGSASVAGFDVVRDGARVRERIGLAGQYAAVDENLTGFENLEMVGRLYHLGRGRARERSRELLASFDLTDAGDRLVGKYSGGMRRRLDLAAALVAEPPVLFPDEPTTGLDLPSRISLWQAIEALVTEGTTVLLTTQYLDEADRLTDRIAVIDHGLVIAEGSPDELKSRVGGDVLEVEIHNSAQCLSAADVLRPLADGGAPFVEGGAIRVPLRRRNGAIAEAVRQLDAAGIGIEDIAMSSPTLTGHVAEHEGEDKGQPVEQERVA
jgi:ABC-2 type transport system ATP-binding protein